MDIFIMLMLPIHKPSICFHLYVYLLIYNILIQISVCGSFQSLQCQTWGQGPLQFLGLLFVRDDQGIKVSAASDFKLHIVLIFLDLDRVGILSPGYEQEVLDFHNFARHGYQAGRE